MANQNNIRETTTNRLNDDILMISWYLWWWYFNIKTILLGARSIVWIRSRSEWSKIRIKTQQMDFSKMKDENNEYSNYPSVLKVDVWMGGSSPSITALENFWNYLVLLKCASIHTCLCYNWSHILENFWRYIAKISQNRRFNKIFRILTLTGSWRIECISCMHEDQCN